MHYRSPWPRATSYQGTCATRAQTCRNQRTADQLARASAAGTRWPHGLSGHNSRRSYVRDREAGPRAEENLHRHHSALPTTTPGSVHKPARRTAAVGGLGALRAHEGKDLHLRLDLHAAELRDLDAIFLAVVGLTVDLRLTLVVSPLLEASAAESLAAVSLR